jgi:hypothetical protein
MVLSNGATLTPEKVDLINKYKGVVNGICLNVPSFERELWSKRAGVNPKLFDKLISNIEYAIDNLPLMVQYKTMSIQINGANVYSFEEKSGNIIGESKYRAATLCRGFILAELDHDDLLTQKCTEYLVNASQKFPDAGFFYTDSAEINQYWQSQTYGEPFALWYGKYRKYNYNGYIWDVAIQPNINPKTIRHIVGVPNHIRAWRKETYFQIGGHNRDLAIADDYELLVRTFLGTLMMRIPRMCYIQFIYNNTTGRNTHDLSRADIQRRVRTIMYHYNEKIAKRFEELGLDDYCYKENPNNPINDVSRIGADENNANKTFNI